MQQVDHSTKLIIASCIAQEILEKIGLSFCVNLRCLLCQEEESGWITAQLDQKELLLEKLEELLVDLSHSCKCLMKLVDTSCKVDQDAPLFGRVCDGRIKISINL